MTGPSDDDDDDADLWEFGQGTSELVWSCDQLDAVNLLFRMELVPVLTPALFGVVFRRLFDGYLPAEGDKVEKIDRKFYAEYVPKLRRRFDEWRDVIASLEAEIDRRSARVLSSMSTRP
jgi:hypothetical protein